jgi:hypothetical protein
MLILFPPAEYRCRWSLDCSKAVPSAKANFANINAEADGRETSLDCADRKNVIVFDPGMFCHIPFNFWKTQNTF